MRRIKSPQTILAMVFICGPCFAVVNPVEPHDALFPNTHYAQSLIDQLEIEKSLLLMERDELEQTGKNTAGDYPITTIHFLPPDETRQIQFDQAKFIVTLRNESGFDAYSPAFNLSITSKSDKSISFKRRFDFKDKANPIATGESRVFELVCCGAIDDPYHNRLMKNLPPDTEIEIELDQIMNHKDRPIMDANIFSYKDHLRLIQIGECIKEIESSLESWTPTGSVCFRPLKREV